MGVALCFLILRIWTKNEQLTVTFKYLIRFSKSRACWIVDHEIVKILHLSFYKQSIFDPRPKNRLSFSKKLPQKIV